MSKLSRKNFLIGTLGAAGAALGLGGTAGCGGDDDGAGGGSGTKSCASSISDNHGHALSIPTADLESTADKTYSIQGASGHDHTVTLVASDFAKLKSGASVIVTATTAVAHAHEVTVTCG